MTTRFTICHEDDIEQVVEALKSRLSAPKTVVLLKGNLGTGKTTLVKHLVKSLDDSVLVDSPTFSLVNTYDLPTALIHHFDLYRLEEIEEIEDIGFWEYIDSNAWNFIEWPEKIADLLPEEKTITVDITLNLEQCREYFLS
jgi:tRNA threonylcarbamoyladenosine biosynthesis protein TsaE